MTAPSPKPDIAAIRARLEAATPGPWAQPIDEEPRAIVAAKRPMFSLLALDRDGMAIVDKKADADLIAHAPTDLRDLLSYVERLEAVAEAAKRFFFATPPVGYKSNIDALREALAAIDGDG